MRYQNWIEALSRLSDAATLSLIDDPVYFPNHPEDPNKFYERSSVFHYFQTARTEILALRRLQQVHQFHIQALRRLQQTDQPQPSEILARVTADMTLQSLLEEYADDYLNGIRVSQILEGEYVVEVSHDFEIPLGLIIPILIEYTIYQVFNKAKQSLENRVGGFVEGEARCPLTRAKLVESDLQSGLIFRNVVLIAMRNAILHNPAEFCDFQWVEGSVTDAPLLSIEPGYSRVDSRRSETAAFMSSFSQLSTDEIRDAEEVLENLLNSRSVPLSGAQKTQLGKWAIHRGNDAVRTLEGSKGTKADQLTKVIHKHAKEMQQRLLALIQPTQSALDEIGLEIATIQTVMNEADAQIGVCWTEAQGPIEREFLVSAEASVNHAKVISANLLSAKELIFYQRKMFFDKMNDPNCEQFSEICNNNVRNMLEIARSEMAKSKVVRSNLQKFMQKMQAFRTVGKEISEVLCMVAAAEHTVPSLLEKQLQLGMIKSPLAKEKEALVNILVARANVLLVNLKDTKRLALEAKTKLVQDFENVEIVALNVQSVRELAKKEHDKITTLFAEVEINIQHIRKIEVLEIVMSQVRALRQAASKRVVEFEVTFNGLKRQENPLNTLYSAGLKQADSAIQKTKICLEELISSEKSLDVSYGDLARETTEIGFDGILSRLATTQAIAQQRLSALSTSLQETEKNLAPLNLMARQITSSNTSKDTDACETFAAHSLTSECSSTVYVPYLQKFRFEWRYPNSEGLFRNIMEISHSANTRRL